MISNVQQYNSLLGEVGKGGREGRKGMGSEFGNPANSTSPPLLKPFPPEK